MNNILNDIYYDKEYIALYLKKNEQIFEFFFQEGDNIFSNISIKRPINSIGKVNLKETFFDLETAYGYGGVFCNTNDKVFLKEAENKYIQKCLDEHIIAEFSRIHPFNTSQENFDSFYDLLIKDRQTISVDSTLSKEERWLKYPSKIRTILRKCAKELTFEKTDDLSSFITLYEMTMSKNNASDFYYFDEHYFTSLLKIKDVELYIVKQAENIIAASFFMFGSEIGHYHLSANDYDFRKFNGNYFILDSIFDIAKDKGIKHFHLGGGRTNAEDDLLLRFKTKFSPIKKEFYLGGKIFNNSKFSEYIDIWKQQHDTDIPYFLKYRLP